MRHNMIDPRRCRVVGWILQVMLVVIGVLLCSHGVQAGEIVLDKTLNVNPERGIAVFSVTLCDALGKNTTVFYRSVGQGGRRRRARRFLGGCRRLVCQ